MKTLTTKIILSSLLVALLLALRIYAAPPKTPTPQIWTPGCVASVPKSWGQFRGGSAPSGLAFEDSAGILRFLTNISSDGTPAVALEIRRTAPVQ